MIGSPTGRFSRWQRCIGKGRSGGPMPPFSERPFPPRPRPARSRSQSADERPPRGAAALSKILFRSPDYLIYCQRMRVENVPAGERKRNRPPVRGLLLARIGSCWRTNRKKRPRAHRRTIESPRGIARQTYAVPLPEEITSGTGHVPLAEVTAREEGFIKSVWTAYPAQRLLTKNSWAARHGAERVPGPFRPTDLSN